MNKKGQAALEFLTTYGWAFLVILIMIGALSYFGVLNPSMYSKSKTLVYDKNCLLDKSELFCEGLGGRLMSMDEINYTPSYVFNESGMDYQLSCYNPSGNIGQLYLPRITRDGCKN